MPKFIDEATILFKAGNGGNGIVAFHREKFVDRGGPSGGDGGNGGSIYLVGDNNKTTLYDLSYRKEFFADNGENGKASKKTGANAEDLEIHVPIGTIATNTENNEIIGELTLPGQRLKISKGGSGGRGNARFATSVNTVPRLSENGTEGKEILARLELKILADIALVGFPSVGKSTMISKMTNSKPKIADYEFTTLIPNIGICAVDDFSFVIADIPGLIEGSSEGRGLGDKFLRHIERCKLIYHLVDSTNDIDVIKEKIEIINNELNKFSEITGGIDQQMIFSKIDLIDEDKINNIKEIYPRAEFVSSFDKKDIFLIKAKSKDILKNFKEEIKIDENEGVHLYKFESSTKNEIIINKISEDRWEVRGNVIEYWSKRIPFTTDQNYARFRMKLISLGVYEILEKKGFEEGDIIEVAQDGLVYEII